MLKVEEYVYICIIKTKYKRKMIKKLSILLSLLLMTTSFSQLSAKDLTADEVITFKVTPTSELKLHVYYPNDSKQGENRPVVVSFFGGGWNGGNPKQFFEQCEYYATLGLVGISAEYRVKSRDKTTPFESVADAKSAIRWVRAHAKELGIDPDRIVASGGSAGGHVAACTALIEKFDDKNDANADVSSVPNAMMLFNPVVNTSSEGYGKASFDGEELTMSPFHNVRAGMPPTLIFHGTQDPTVPFKNAVDFTNFMKACGNDIRFVTAFGAPHSFFNGKLMGQNRSTQHYERSMYECAKFLIDIKYVPQQELTKPAPIRIACVGDGVMMGVGLADPSSEACPAQLESLLGDDYQVKSFGFEGATILANGGKPFFESDEYKELYSYEADVIIIMLGAEDSKAAVWGGKGQFVARYKNLVSKLRANPNNKPEIYLYTPTPIFTDVAKDASAQSNAVVAKEINPLIAEVARNTKVKQFNAPEIGENLYNGAVYPNAAGAKQLAKHIYETIGSQAVLDAKFEVPRDVNSDTFEGVLQSSPYHEMRDGLKNSYKKFTEKKAGTVAFVGGSITWNPGWRDYVCEYLQKKFPDTKFTFINAGISSEGTLSAAYRLERDVLSHGTIDLMFEEAAVNDRAGGELRTTETSRIRGMEGIVRHARAENPMLDIVIMQFVEPVKMTQYNSGKTPQEIIDFESVAEHYGIPSINLAKEVTDRINAGEFTWKDDFKNLHPSPFGQRVYARSMTDFLDRAYEEGAKAKKMTKYKMPKPIDALCYDQGCFVTVDKATLGEGWSVTQTWRPTNGQSMRDINNLHLEKPAIVAVDKTAGELTFQFVGSTVGFVGLSGADAGTINYKIDGKDYGTCDLLMNYSLTQYLPRYFMLATDLDPKKTHTLTITLADEANPKSKGNACYIARFFVNGKGVK